MSGDDVVLVGFAIASVASAVAFRRHARRHRGESVPTRALVAGNALAAAALVFGLLFVGEVYWRFVFDSTDSFGLTKVSRRWVERHVERNAQGFRDDVDYWRTPPVGASHRLTFLGDSFLAGYGVDDVRDRFANRLRAARPDWDVQVLARFGSDTRQALRDLRDWIDRGHRLERVVLVYCLNDIQGASPAAALHDARIERYRTHEPGWLVRHSFLLDRLSFRLRAAFDPALADYFGLLARDYRGAAWSVQKTHLDALVELARDEGVDLRVVTFPFLHALGDDYAFREAHERLDAFWASRGVPHLDLLDVFEGDDPDDLVVNDWDAHPNVDAHARAAEAMLPFLDEPGGELPARADPTLGSFALWPATDQGVLLPHDRSADPDATCTTPGGVEFAGACDALGARDAWLFEAGGRYLLHYDAAGAIGWLNALATSPDLATWTKHGPILDLGAPGEDDAAGADYGVPFLDDDGRWHLFYLGAAQASPPPERIPAIPYTTMKAIAEAPTGPWRKQPGVRPFDPEPGTWTAETTSPGPILRRGDEYVQVVSGAAHYGDTLYRTLGLARTRDLDGTWTIEARPILPPTEQIENASLYYEASNQTWFLFTNRVDVSGRFTDAIVVYWSDDPERWSVDRKALVLDGRHSRWSPSVIGLPSVLRVGDRLAIVYDGLRDRSPSHMGRDIGIAWLDLPLDPAAIERAARVGVARRWEMTSADDFARIQQLDVRFEATAGGGSRLRARSTAPHDDPFLRLAGADLQASEFDELRFRARIRSASGARGSIYFFHDEGHDLLGFDVEPDWHTYRVDLAGSPAWAGPIRGLRIDPPPATAESPVEVEIDWIELRTRRARGR